MRGRNIEVKESLDKIVPIRLSPEQWKELERHAKDLGMGPVALAKLWILEKIASFD